MGVVGGLARALSVERLVAGTRLDSSRRYGEF